MMVFCSKIAQVAKAIEQSEKLVLDAYDESLANSAKSRRAMDKVCRCGHCPSGESKDLRGHLAEMVLH